jgi:hypothetical protein
MFIHYYPLWDFSIWYNLSFDHNKLDSILLELYQKTLVEQTKKHSDDETKQLQFVNKNKHVIINQISSINDFVDEGRYYELPVNHMDIINSFKVGFLVDPVIRVNYLQKHNSKFNDKPLTDFVDWLYGDYKNKVLTGNTQDRPQWYFYSNSTNECIMNLMVSLIHNKTDGTFVLNNLGVMIDYITKKEVSAKDKLTDLHNNIANDLEQLEKKTNDIFHNNGLYYKIHQLYQNDYYFFDELTYKHTYNYDYMRDEIPYMREKHNKLYKQNAFTIITPTMGSPNLFKLKQVLKQEKLNYIHIILWDKNRKPMTYNGDELTPEYFEDECTYCYEFIHPYFEFPKQRNDVWLRGVGCTLTNTPYITFHDDDTWPERNHLDDVMRYMNFNHLDYTYVARRMWENGKDPIGKDDFEATGELNKFGYRLIDNSSLYLDSSTARSLSNMFLSNQVYGDDRLTYDHLTQNKKNGMRYDKILVNHIAKEQLIPFFKSNILGTL